MQKECSDWHIDIIKFTTKTGFYTQNKSRLELCLDPIHTPQMIFIQAISFQSSKAQQNQKEVKEANLSNPHKSTHCK